MPPSQWFCTLLEGATDVYFRFSLLGPRGFVYVSPSVQALTGHTAEEFAADRELCLQLIATAGRRQLRRVLRSRGPITLTLLLVRDGIEIPVELRTVAVVKHRRVVAIEGMARLARSSRPAEWSGRPSGRPNTVAADPIQPRLAALMVEVHDLWHRVLPLPSRVEAARSNTLRFLEIALDTDRLSVTESGRVVSLTPREVQLLRYLIERAGRVIGRSQLLTDVWGYSYTGDDRTVDVHISRLKKKLPSLRGRLVALRNLGYRLDGELEVQAVNS